MDYSIVDAAVSHIAGIHRLEKECFSMPWTEEMLLHQLKDDRHEFIAAVCGDGTVLGYVGMMYVIDEGYISNVAVSPEFRRMGIADSLISALETIAQERGLSFLTLEVRASNLPAIRLYEKHGFLTVGRRRNYYEQPKEDALLMTYFLKRGMGVENPGV